MAGETGKAGTRQALAAVAREKALLPFRGGEGGNIAPLFYIFQGQVSFLARGIGARSRSVSSP